PLQNPQWAVQTLNPSYQPGFTVGAKYALSSPGKDIRVNWDRLRTSDATAAAVSNPSTQWISPFSQTGPSMSESANQVGIFHFKSAQGLVAFDYDMVNIDFSQTVNIGSRTQVRLFTGLAYARLREQLISTFYNDPNINPVPPVVAVTDPSLKYISLNNTSTFNGLGPRLGANTTCNVFRRFTLVGQLSGAVLAGWMQPAQYSFAGVFSNTVDSEQIASKTVSQVVWAGDAKLGAGYSRPFSNGSVLSIESGFRAAVFINSFSTYETSTNVLPLDIGSLSTSSMRHTPSNFTLNGFYANCSLNW
ncbi:MAG TPA: Lpg1974 family pore-forming outer membrane protein, partial [Pirellulales bacterium]|nr:Lpg1974 family pore-forming outer membrane protein [Pirellulales bacterium]